MIINLLLINVIVVMVFLSGFVDSIDGAINRRFPFHHLPKPFSCSLCMTFWTSVLYVLFMREFTLLNFALCLANAHLTEITTPLITVIKNWLKRIIIWIMPR